MIGEKVGLARCSSKQVSESAGEVARHAAVQVNWGGSGVRVKGQALLLLRVPSLEFASVQEAAVYLRWKAQHEIWVGGEREFRSRQEQFEENSKGRTAKKTTYISKGVLVT